MTDINKQAYDAAKQEHQNKEKEYIKKIVLDHLEKIDKYQEEKRKIEDKINLLRKNLDYLKEGRLDKIEEMQDIVPNYSQISPIFCQMNSTLNDLVYRPEQYNLVFSQGKQLLNGKTVKQWSGGAYKVGNKIIYF